MHRVAVAHGAPAFIEGLPPVEADHIGAGRGHFAQQARGLHAKVDHRHAHLLNRAHQALGGLEGVLAIVGEAERADPTVEDLNHIRAGLNLKAAILFENVDDLVEQTAPGSRCREYIICLVWM